VRVPAAAILVAEQDALVARLQRRDVGGDWVTGARADTAARPARDLLLRCDTVFSFL
jgi:hypothetical protein